jgi:Carboxypeptidase regulatory-like domain
MARRLKSRLTALALAILGCTSFCFGQAPQPTPPPLPEHPATASVSEQPAQPGAISGTVVDQSGAVIVGARVRLNVDVQSQSLEVLTGDDGQFSFANVAPGPFRLTVTSPRFATQTFSGVLGPGATNIVPQIAMAVAADVEVQVKVTPVEVAEEQIQAQEKQRVLGFIPNFYVSYVPNPVPLTSKQKFKLAWKTTIDPVTILLNGAFAGVEQAQNHFKGYGQGAEGYGKRFGAGYADIVTNTFIGGAILPSILKQDPRYFYKGTGSTPSRIRYAIAFAVICKGDNGHWQANYSGIIGSLAAGGISNLYYPAADRNGAALTFENAGIGIGATAIANLFQEFVVRKFTPKIPHNDPAKP